VAEWLRRWIANPLLFECVSSNPTDVESIFFIMVFLECNSVQQLLLLLLILETKALGAATHSLIWYPIYTPPRLACFIYSSALEIGTTTGLQLQHLHDLLNKYTAFILLLYFDHVLLLCP
jgi:hypothetical protein